MPQVGNKKFPYTPSGIRQAKQAYDRKRNPLASAMTGFNRKQKLGAALNQLRNQSATDARLKERAAQLDPPNQRTATPPNRRQAIATQLGQDKVYRPDRDGPKVPMDQVTAPGTPDKRGSSRRPSGIVGIRFPGRPLPFRPLPRPGKGRGPLPTGAKRPGGRPLGVGGMRPSRRPIRPGRGALAPRPWRPKPPNRKYL